MKLPVPNNGHTESKDDKKKDEKSEAEKQIAELATQLENMNKIEQDKKAVEADVIAKAAQKKEEDRIAAEADLKELLSSSTKEDDKSGNVINDLNNSELLDVIGDAVTKSTNAQIEQALNKVGASIGETNEGVKMLSKVIGQMVASQDFEKVKSGHVDFDVYKKEIFAIMTKYPSMEIEDAYNLAKGQKIGDAPGANNLEMERGSNTFALPFDMAQGVNRDPANEVTLKGSHDRSVNQDTEVRVDNTHGVQAFRKYAAKAAAKVVGSRPLP